ncbi:hypothetical protein EXIGLDRAFT_266164 [Exidia glandulosa HHB12029]|uniref:Uncharacterized protein n=1 Tax=Exidia glandulosa HHB12029 TaxID=1314781 RepID=A0A165MA58_EXIGL|nr:hypothetical protein EXIGLDRAFT_266164 [Exidia glandulosa HHB12029]
MYGEELASNVRARHTHENLREALGSRTPWALAWPLVHKLVGFPQGYSELYAVAVTCSFSSSQNS